MQFLFGMILSGALLGVIVALLERSSFPGWGPMIGCALAIGLATSLAIALLPDSLWMLGYFLGAGAGAFLLAWLGHLPLQRAALAAGIYLVLRVLLALALGV
jgi:hypothetical protein